MAASRTVRISFDSSFCRCFSASSGVAGCSFLVASEYLGMIFTAHYGQRASHHEPTFSRVCIFVASLTFPILPAPRVFCSCQSPTILPLGFSLPFLLLDPPFELRIDFDTAAEAASSRTSRMVGSCGAVAVGGGSVADLCGERDGVRLL